MVCETTRLICKKKKVQFRGDMSSLFWVSFKAGNHENHNASKHDASMEGPFAPGTPASENDMLSKRLKFAATCLCKDNEPSALS